MELYEPRMKAGHNAIIGKSQDIVLLQNRSQRSRHFAWKRAVAVSNLISFEMTQIRVLRLKTPQIGCQVVSHGELPCHMP